jgi:hypothetical protein
MPSKNYTLFFIFSVAFVLLSIGFITILGQKSSNPDDTSTDLRAKAGVAAALKIKGTVSAYNPGEKTLIVNNVQFDTAGQNDKSMGTFTVTVTQKDFQASLGRPGTNVLLSVDAESFNTLQKTMTASSVSSR